MNAPNFLRVRDELNQPKLVAFSEPLLRIHAAAALVIPLTSEAPGLAPELRVRRMADTKSLLGRLGRSPTP